MDVTVTDSDDGTGSQSYAITVNPAITVSPSTLRVPTVGNSYSEQFTASGGSGTGYSYSATGVPAGLTLNAGLLSGTPTSATPFTMIVTVTDGIDATAIQSYTVTVDPALTLSPPDLPTPIVGDSYSQRLTASGGSGTGYVFSSGALPPGLTLSTDGVLRGTPTTGSGAVFTVEVTVADSDGGTTSRNYVLTVKQGSQAGGVVASLPQTFYGENDVLTATFSATESGSAPMTGTVAFYDGTSYLGTAHLIATSSIGNDSSAISPAASPATVSGQASLPTSGLSVGEHVIKAIYSGDANYSSATSDTPVSVNVAPATTSTTLRSATTPNGTILTAKVVVTSPGNPPIVGSISFYDGNTLLGTEPVIDGVATLNIGTLSPGAHNFSANYSGGGTASTSGATVAVQTDGPQVTSVQRYGFHAQWTYLVIHFNGPLMAASAEDVANYKIVGPGGHRIKVTSAVYDPSTNRVTLKPADRINIHHRYWLTIEGTRTAGLTNPAGLFLDGAGSGQSGSDYVTSITWRNLAGRASQLPASARVQTDARSHRSAKVSSHRVRST
jgi:hypothetical protein